MIKILFDLANIVMLVGTCLQIFTVLKDRNILKGYSIPGSFLTFLGVLLFELGFYLGEYYFSAFLGLFTLIYWFLVTVYSIKLALKQPRTRPKVFEIKEKAGVKSNARK